MNYQTQFYEVPNSSHVRYETSPKIIKDKEPLSLTQNEPSPINQCKICGLVNFNAWALTMHMRRHNNERPAKCSICPASFVNNTELKSHMTKHTNEKRHKCRFCPETFSSNSSRYFHEDKHGILLHKCKFCEEKFKTKVQRRLHHKSHGKEDLTCNYCPKKFANSDYLKLHEENDHGRVIKSLKCFKCKLKFSTKEALMAHKKLHRSMVPGMRRAPVNPKSNEVSYFQDSDVKLSSYFFTCGVCSEKFSFHIDLTKHIENNHSDDKDKVYKFKCDVCNKSFDSQVKLRGHKIGHGPKKHKCPQCEYRTARAKDLERHIEARHSNYKAYKCSECGEAFTQYYNFVSHKLKHGEKKFKCTLCDKAYYVKSRLSKHVRSVHNSEKQICDQCGRVYCNMLSLKVHKNYMHKTPPLCLCNKCGKSILVNEVQMHHNVCTGTQNCDLSLASNTKLKGPFCLECNITFSVPRYLLEHCKEFHPENVYPCSACQNEYLSPDSAEKHYTRVHGIKEKPTQKHNSVFTIEEKRLLRSDNLSSIFQEHYECYACGYSFLFESELDIHLSLPSCLKPMPYIDCFAKDKFSDINLFSITKVHDNGYQIAETNSFEVKVVPQSIYSESLGISIVPSINSEVRNNKNAKKIKVRSSKIKKAYEIKKTKLPNLDTSHIKKDYDTLPDVLAPIPDLRTVSKVEPIDTNLDNDSEALNSIPGNGIISSKNLMDLLQGKIVNLHGQSFLPLNEVMEHLRQISAISLNSQ